MSAKSDVSGWVDERVCADRVSVVQRPFAELLPSEKAAVLEAQYGRIRGTMKCGQTDTGSGGHGEHRYKTRDLIASEYGFSNRSAARYLRLNNLIEPFKEMVDCGRIGLVGAVDLSYLRPDEQELLWQLVNRQELKLNAKMAAELKKQTGSLTEEKIADIIDAMHVKKNSNAGVNVTLPKSVCKKYFSGMSEAEMMELLEAALSAFFQADTKGAA